MAAYLALLCLAYSAVPALGGGFSWQSFIDQSKPSKGDGTFYGQQSDQDAAGACSYGKNFANSTKMPWSSNADMTVALNDAQWELGAGCGLCVRFRGTGAGIGTTPIATSHWQTGFVNNRCPECSPGDLDLNANANGRWKIEWYAVPCPVGNSTFRYDIVVSSQYWFSMVISNTRVPVANVSVKIGGNWLPLKRSSNNQWPYYNTNGPWQGSFPMPVRITSATGEVVEDNIPNAKGGVGSKQFTEVGGGSSGNSTSSGDSTSSGNSTSPGNSTSSGSSSSPSGSPAGNSTWSSPSPASASGSPSPSSSSSSPVASPSGSPKSSGSSASPSPSGSPSSPSPAAGSGEKMPIEDYGQCGGNALSCGKGYTTPCISAPWPTAVCRSSGWTCNRYDDGLYQCQPPKAGASSNSNYADVSVGGRRRLQASI